MWPCVFVQPGSVPTARSGLTLTGMAPQWHGGLPCSAPTPLAPITTHQMRHEKNRETAS